MRARAYRFTRYTCGARSERSARNGACYEMRCRRQLIRAHMNPYYIDEVARSG